MANTLSVNQVSTLLRAVLKQATGQENLDSLDTSALLTIGQKSLASGYDPLLGAITQVISRTVFSNRPYTRKFSALMTSPEKWGNVVRKLVVLEKENNLEDNPYLPLTDGSTVDQYTVNKGKVLELKFIGQQTYEFTLTIFDNQLNTAFNSAEEFGSFMSMLFQNVYNKIEKTHEETARATVAGFIGGKLAGDTSNVIHLLTEYNAKTGLNLTATTVYQPDNFGPFMKWCYARINTISNMMTEYSIKYHTNVADGLILRHTPKQFQCAYFLAEPMTEMTDRVLADTYHNTLLKLPGAELVNFWQDIDSPDSISLAAPQYLAANGTIATASAPVEQAHIFGVLFDREAMGYSPILNRVTTTPYNAKGEYRNQFWKFNERHYIDFTENGVVFLLD